MTDFCVQAISHIPASSGEKIDIQEIVFSFRAPGAVPSVPVCASIWPGLRFLCLAAQLARQEALSSGVIVCPEICTAVLFERSHA